jgi:hypothetical protein
VKTNPLVRIVIDLFNRYTSTAPVTVTATHSQPVWKLFDVEPGGADLLFMGPTTTCVCGGEVFHALIWFDNERSIAGYFTEMCCAACGSLIRGATQSIEETA